MNNPSPQIDVISASEHGISQADISKQALDVLLRLKDAGYDSYLVGGCVRDLILGYEPKDFDVVTNASPEQVRKLFRNCRLIGRRFRLAHVRYGREIIEVATYRAAPQETDESADMAHSDSGRILRDNVYGTIEEDAIRRDFACNALYFNVADATVRDYVGGYTDVKQGILRVIGDPDRRYREDPVRMIRAIRFAAKLGLRIEEKSREPIVRLGYHLQEVPPARMFEEILKLFHSGMAMSVFEMLRHYELFQYLFPATDHELDHGADLSFNQLVTLSLSNTDARINEGKPVTPAFLYAVMLWRPVMLGMETRQADGMAPQDALRSATSEVFHEQAGHTSVPKRFSMVTRDIWVMQKRFELRGGKRAHRLFDHQRFRAAYDFLCLRARAGEVEPGLCEWWTEFQEVDLAGREKMIKTLGPSQRKTRRRRRKHRGDRVEGPSGRNRTGNNPSHD